MLWHALRIGYFVVWFILLIHCVRSKRFFPILDSGKLTKVLWCLTFAFFNPILTILYFVFGVCLKPFATEKRRLGHIIGSVIAVVLIVAVLVVFEIPVRRSNSRPMITDANSPTQRNLLDVKAQAGILRAQNNHTETKPLPQDRFRFTATSRKD